MKKKLKIDDIIIKDVNIFSYDIPIQNCTIWIDFGFVIFNTFLSYPKRIVSNVFDDKEIFFYHPQKNDGGVLMMKVSIP